MVDIDYRKLLTTCREIYPDKKSDRKCPECAKSENGPKWEPWMGSLKDHLVEHYRIRYYFDKIKEDPKFRKPKHYPWSVEYEEVTREKLEKYLDKDIFEQYFKIKKRREEERLEREREKERRKLLVDKENERRRLEFETRFKENRQIFSESDSDSDSKKKTKKIKRKRGLSSSSDSDGQLVAPSRPRKKSRDEPEVRRNRPEVESMKRKSSISTVSTPKAKRAKPLPKQELQKHNLELNDFIEQLGELERRFCPMCDREVDLDRTPYMWGDEPMPYEKQYENHVMMCGV